MADDTWALETQAAGLMREASEEQSIELSKTRATMLVDAIKHCLDRLADEKMEEEDRIGQLETQTQVLAEAVIAITKIQETLTPAISAECAALDTASVSRILGRHRGHRRLDEYCPQGPRDASRACAWPNTLRSSTGRQAQEVGRVSLTLTTCGGWR